MQAHTISQPTLAPLQLQLPGKLAARLLLVLRGDIWYCFVVK